MKLKDGKFVLGIFVTIVAILIFGGVLVHATLYAPEEEAPPPPGYTDTLLTKTNATTTTKVAVSKSGEKSAPIKKTAAPLPPVNPKAPVRIKIPILKVDAKVQSV